MVRSSALYISLIISILIVIICGSVLLAAYMYRMHESKITRHERLLRNLTSASLLVLHDSFTYDKVQRIQLFDSKDGWEDSVILEKRQWGIYELGLVTSFKNSDSIKKAFLIGSPLKDTIAALYIADEDRPVSISGKSRIEGAA